MRTLFIGTLASTALCAFVFAQEPAPPPNAAPTQPNSATSTPANNTPQASGPLRPAPGSVIPVQLVKNIDAKKMKSGDQVEVKVTRDLKAANGEVLIPKDTKFVGHVTEVQARTKEQKESQLAIVFDHEVLKSGEDVSLPMSIQAIIAPQGPGSPDTSTSDMAGRSGAPASPGGAMGTARSAPGSEGNTPSIASPEPANDASAKRPPITGNTQGVIGISNLKLSEASDKTQGSLLTSDNGNVKVEGGTMMLLRVNSNQ